MLSPFKLKGLAFITFLMANPALTMESMPDQDAATSISDKNNDAFRDALSKVSEGGDLEPLRKLLKSEYDTHKISIMSSPKAMALLHELRTHNKAFLDLLLEFYVDVHQETHITTLENHPFNVTPLFAVIFADWTEAVELLITRGADVNRQNSDGITALWCAIRANSPEIVELLIAHGANIESISDMISPLFQAILRSNLQMVQLLLAHGAQLTHVQDVSPLVFACSIGNVAICEELLRNNANVNEIDERGNTPFSCALRENNTEVLNLLLAYGAKFTRINGYTPLIYACGMNNPKLCALLIQHGADINEQDDHGDTPLTLACRMGNTSAVEELLKHDVNVNSTGRGGRTAIREAVKYPEIFQLLLAKNSDLHHQTETDGTTALLGACVWRQPSIVKPLLEHGCNPDVLTVPYKTSPLMAICCGVLYTRINNLRNINGNPINLSTELSTEDLEIAQLLLDHGANINAQDSNGITPLMITMNCIPAELQSLIQDVEGEIGQPIDRDALCCDIELRPLANLLLDNGANRDLKNNEKRTARDSAVINGKENLVQLLDSHTLWASGLKLKAAKALFKSFATKEASEVQHIMKDMPEELRTAVTLIAPKAIKDKIKANLLLMHMANGLQEN